MKIALSILFAALIAASAIACNAGATVTPTPKPSATRTKVVIQPLPTETETSKASTPTVVAIGITPTAGSGFTVERPGGEFPGCLPTNQTATVLLDLVRSKEEKRSIFVIVSWLKHPSRSSAIVFHNSKSGEPLTMETGQTVYFKVKIEGAGQRMANIPLVTFSGFSADGKACFAWPRDKGIQFLEYKVQIASAKIPSCLAERDLFEVRITLTDGLDRQVTGRVIRWQKAVSPGILVTNLTENRSLSLAVGDFYTVTLILVLPDEFGDLKTTQEETKLFRFDGFDGQGRACFSFP